MRTLDHPGARCWLRPARAPHRKLPWTLTLLDLPGRGRALVDTALPNRIVAEAVAGGRIAELSGYTELRREVRVGDAGSRLDVRLRARGRRDCTVEIKCVTMASATVPRRADFPDSVTERGLRHVQELERLAMRGERAVLFFLVGRTDCRAAGLAEEIDPAYAAAVRAAAHAGVEVLAYRISLRRDRATAGRRCPWELDDRELDDQRAERR